MDLGILGGTFDPIHLGHLLLAEQAREFLRLDRVLLIPASRPPHKPDRVISPWADRHEMCRLAVRGVPGLEISDLEREDEEPSYTVETLRRLAAAEPGANLWLLVGEDSLKELGTWREPAEICRLAHLGVYERPQEGEPSVTQVVHAAAADDPLPEGARTTRLPGPRLRLASTEIRQRVADGRSIRFLVPDAVRDYIVARGLYRPERTASVAREGVGR